LLYYNLTVVHVEKLLNLKIIINNHHNRRLIYGNESKKDINNWFAGSFASWIVFSNSNRVEPVFAFNYQSSPKIKNMDNGIKIDNSGNQYGKEKIYNGNSLGNGYGQINPNDHQGDPFKIKNHPVLK
jgi:hypothetical protein